jgi:hypothetical protein
MSTTIPNNRIDLVQTYGHPGVNGLDKGWYDRNVVRMDLPYPMRLAWDVQTTIRTCPVHRLAAPDLFEILQEVYNECRIQVKRERGFDLSTERYDHYTAAKLAYYGLDLFGGTFNYRLVRGGSSLSLHAYGIAIDLDPAHNALGDTTPRMPAFVVKAFEDKGWFWGGRWKGSRCDGMHFQRARGC